MDYFLERELLSWTEEAEGRRLAADLERYTQGELSAMDSWKETLPDLYTESDFPSGVPVRITQPSPPPRSPPLLLPNHPSRESLIRELTFEELAGARAEGFSSRGGLQDSFRVLTELDGSPRERGPQWISAVYSWAQLEELASSKQADLVCLMYTLDSVLC